mmetsp:Transcript_38452/g.96658  ORF Transcript_38452/g.96658 Transcript_38452/m.96658 type:complete len:332 (+) Transcript_38452:792-1787(+)
MRLLPPAAGRSGAKRGAQAYRRRGPDGRTPGFARASGAGARPRSPAPHELRARPAPLPALLRLRVVLRFHRRGRHRGTLPHRRRHGRRPPCRGERQLGLTRHVGAHHHANRRRRRQRALQRAKVLRGASRPLHRAPWRHRGLGLVPVRRGVPGRGTCGLPRVRRRHPGGHVQHLPRLRRRRHRRPRRAVRPPRHDVPAHLQRAALVGAHALLPRQRLRHERTARGDLRGRSCPAACGGGRRAAGDCHGVCLQWLPVWRTHRVHLPRRHVRPVEPAGRGSRGVVGHCHPRRRGRLWRLPHGDGRHRHCPQASRPIGGGHAGRECNTPWLTDE